MVKLAIRDDDLSALSKIEDIEQLYPSTLSVPISFAVVPYIMDVLGGCPDTMNNKNPIPLTENPDLIEWLKNNLHNGKCDVLLHGLTHEYHFGKTGKKIPEMVWKSDESNLESQIHKAKKFLQDLLDIPIICFVAPNNMISEKCLCSVIANNLHLSGIIPLQFQRSVTMRNIFNYTKRFAVRTIYGIPYPGILRYSDHLEINACGLRSMDYLKKIFAFCQQYEQPMIINVHYWDLRDNKSHRKMLFDFIDYALQKGAVPATVSQILKERW